jgi:Nucleotidyl transferase AbiEii toxin, Type IV TA system
MVGKERDLEWLRRQLVRALAADDDLFDLLVFKGGNALALVHGIGLRASLDLDYSLAEEAENSQVLGETLERALGEGLSREGLMLFDWNFSVKPSTLAPGQDPRWGGYLGEFKVIETELWKELGEVVDQARKRAWGVTASGGAARKFCVELSRNEFCGGASEKELGDGYTVKTYTLAMIAAEKLRAICQQMPEYSKKRKARGRDFYDIHAIVSEASVDLASPTNMELIRGMFDAKSVPLKLLGLIEKHSFFHEGEWPDVRNTIPTSKRMDFEFYREFLMDVVSKLEPLWAEDTP